MRSPPRILLVGNSARGHILPSISTATREGSKPLETRMSITVDPSSKTRSSPLTATAGSGRWDVMTGWMRMMRLIPLEG